MEPKKPYRNALRSRRMIREAFVELLHEKPFEKITATDIINRSGLNRSTFYAHYPDARGILEDFTGEIVTLFRQMLAEMDFSSFLNDPESILKKVDGETMEIVTGFYFFEAPKSLRMVTIAMKSKDACPLEEKL